MYGAETSGIMGGSALVATGSTLAATGVTTGSLIISTIAVMILLSSGIALVIRARRNRINNVAP